MELLTNVSSGGNMEEKKLTLRQFREWLDEHLDLSDVDDYHSRWILTNTYNEVKSLLETAFSEIEEE